MRKIIFLLCMMTSFDTFAYQSWCWSNGGDSPAQLQGETVKAYVDVNTVQGGGLEFIAPINCAALNILGDRTPYNTSFFVVSGSTVLEPLGSIYETTVIPNLDTGEFNLPISNTDHLLVILRGGNGQTLDESYIDFKVVMKPIPNLHQQLQAFSGKKIATFKIRMLMQYGHDGKGGYNRVINVDVYSKNDFVTHKTSCDVDNKAISIDMGKYPEDNAKKDIGLSVACTMPVNVSFSIKNSQNFDNNSSSFTNTLTAGAEGVGVQILKEDTILNVGDNISIGKVGSTRQSLGLKAVYKRIDREKLKPGPFSTIINLSFTYN